MELVKGDNSGEEEAWFHLTLLVDEAALADLVWITKRHLVSLVPLED